MSGDEKTLQSACSTLLAAAFDPDLKSTLLGPRLLKVTLLTISVQNTRAVSFAIVRLIKCCLMRKMQTTRRNCGS